MKSEELDKKIEKLQKKLGNTEELNAINEKLTKLRKKRINALETSKKYLEETDPEKDPKVYSEVKEEIRRREKELEDIENDIKAYNSIQEEMKKIDINKKQKELKEKANKLKKIQDVISKIDKNIDKKMYEEALEELESREKEYNKLEEEIKDAEKIYEKSNRSLNKIMEKYNIKMSKEFKNDEKKANDPKQIDSKEKNFSKDDEKKENKLSKSLQSELDRYSELISKGYDINSPEMIEFYKEIAKERRISAEEEKEIINENVDSKYSIVPVNDKMKNNEKYEIVPTQDKHEIVPIADAETGNIEKLSIIYSGKENKYIVRNYEEIVRNAKIEDNDELQKHITTMNQILSEPIEGIKFKNKKQKLEYINKGFDEDEIKYLFGDKNIKKIARKCDVQLLSILADLDMNMAKNYVKELAKGRNQKKEPLEYDMKYNLKGMKSNKVKNELSFFQRVKINRMAKKNYEQGVAEYIQDDKNRSWLIFPVAAALAVGVGGSIANNQKNDETKQNKTPERTDTMTPDVETSTTEHTTESIAQDKSQLILKNDDTQVDNEKINNDLILGSIVKMPSGITYTQDSLENGKTGIIGELSYRPEGDYVLDRVALWYNGKLMANLGTEGTNINQEIEKIAQKLGVDPSEIEQKAHISLGEDHTGPTGWIKADEFNMDDIKANISKTYDQIQQEKAALQNQKNTAQQDYEDR